MEENTIKIIGKSNTGKTKNILFNEIKKEIDKENNLIILDSKEEYYNNFGKELIDKDYEIKVINFKEPKKSNGWDPLEYIKYNYDETVDKAAELSKLLGEIIFRNTDENADPFWENSAASYTCGAILALIRISRETNDDKICNFGSLCSIINSADKKINNNTYMMEYCNNINIMDPDYIALSTTVFAPTDTRGGIIAVTKENLNPYFMRPTLLSSFYNNEFKINKIEKNNKKQAIFIIGYNPLEKLTALLIEYLYDAIIKFNKKYTFILDNFDCIEYLPSMEKIIDSAYNEKLKLYIVTKNDERLKEKYPKYTFDSIEKNIVLEEKININIKEELLEYPNLKNDIPIYINFEEYVKKINN